MSFKPINGEVQSSALHQAVRPSEAVRDGATAHVGAAAADTPSDPAGKRRRTKAALKPPVAVPTPRQFLAQQVEVWPIDKLLPYARNARQHTAADRKAVQAYQG